MSIVCLYGKVSDSMSPSFTRKRESKEKRDREQQTEEEEEDPQTE